MSWKLQGKALERDIPPAEKLILIMLASWADDDGTSIYPSKPHIAHRTGYSERYVQQIIAKFIERGWLTDEGYSQFRTKIYTMHMDQIPVREPYEVRYQFTPGVNPNTERTYFQFEGRPHERVNSAHQGVNSVRKGVNPNGVLLLSNTPKSYSREATPSACAASPNPPSKEINSNGAPPSWSLE